MGVRERYMQVEMAAAELFRLCEEHRAELEESKALVKELQTKVMELEARAEETRVYWHQRLIEFGQVPAE